MGLLISKLRMLREENSLLVSTFVFILKLLSLTNLLIGWGGGGFLIIFVLVFDFAAQKVLIATRN